MISDVLARFNADLVSFEVAHEVQVRTDDDLPLIVSMEHDYSFRSKSRVDIVTWVFDLPFNTQYPVKAVRVVNRDGMIMPVDKFEMSFNDYRVLPLADFSDSINYGDDSSFDRASEY